MILQDDFLSLLSYSIMNSRRESARSRLKLGQRCLDFATSPPSDDPDTAKCLNRNEQMEATSDEVEVKKLIVARYLERLKEAR